MYLLESPLTANPIFLETSNSQQLTPQEQPQLTHEPELTSPLPKPKPRVAKSPLDTSSSKPAQEQHEEQVEEDVEVSYSDKKKFWESVGVSKDASQVEMKKRMSLCEELSHEKVIPRKRTSLHDIHEVGSAIPIPIPKPRSMLQTSSTQDSEDEEELISKPMSEYQARFVDHTQTNNKKEAKPEKVDKQKQILMDIHKEARILEKSDSSESDNEISQERSSTQHENTGYISDSGDVEHYISDSEIEDRVPQIRERQMSIAQPITAPRKTIYERSMSLPTEDLYEVSAQSIRLRKKYFEEQIKKDMVEDELMTKLEEESSPEHKTLESLQSMDVEDEQPPGMKSAPEIAEEDSPQSTVRDIAKTFGSTVKTKSDEKPVPKDKQSSLEEEKEETDLSRKSVKDLAKSFEDEHIICPKPVSKPKREESLDKIHDIKDFQEIVKTQTDEIIERYAKSIKETKQFIEKESFDDGKDESMSATHKLEQQSDGSHKSPIDTHKEAPIAAQTKQKSIDSDQPMSDTSVTSSQLNDYQRPSDSLEVHVDKSEIEDSEKMTDLDGTDIETKSMDSLNAIDSSPKAFDSDERRKDLKFPSEEEKEVVSPIKQPEEHVQNIIWEAPVQSQMLEERVELLPESEVKQVFVETDDLSSSVREESDLGSEIHQDHSVSVESDRAKSDSQADIEKMILESLQNQKISPNEAKLIASELVADIETEIRRRHSSTSNSKEVSGGDLEQVPISDYLQQLADAKGLDSREVQLVQSVLARKQRELTRLSREDTQASSMEITDEDLKYSGGEVDYSPSGSRAHILEEQIDQLQAERVLDAKSELEALITEDANAKTTEKTTEKTHTESMSTFEDEVYKNGAKYKTSSTTRHKESMMSEKSLSEQKNIIMEEDDTILESLSEECEKTEKQELVEKVQVESLKKPDLTDLKTTTILSQSGEQKSHVDLAMKITDKISDTKESTTVKTEGSESISDKRVSKEKMEVEELKKLAAGAGMEKTTARKLSESEKEIATKTHVVAEGTAEVLKSGEVAQTVHAHTTIENVSTSVDRIHEESKVYKERIIDDISDPEVKTLIESGVIKMDKGEVVQPCEEITQIIHEEISRTGSSESKSSQEDFGKSTDQMSSSSSESKDTDAKTDDDKVIFRKCFSKDVDTSSSSSLKKGDRKSGLEFETYSSSGESHYHSFELDSSKSRPCSSDVENLFVPGGSSEYESAVTSQDISAPSHMTSNEYHTAVSTLSSKESMKSLDSESSGNLASVEVSEASETLVPSAFELEGDILDNQEDIVLLEHPRLKTRQSTEMSDSELLNYQSQEDAVEATEENSVNGPIEIPSKMKRSCEMTFQPEPKMLMSESPQLHEGEEKFGTSLDEGSVLSVSLSSTSSAQLRTVIETGNMTVSGTSEQLSLDDLDNLPPHSFGESILIPHSAEISTSTHPQQMDQQIESVTITTSMVDENGVQSVSTQVTSETSSLPLVFDTTQPPAPSNGFVDTEPKKRGHRRTESSSFTPSMIQSLSHTTVERKLHHELAESDKYTSELSYKEVRSDEKKDVDESYETEADQAYHKDVREGRYLEPESDNDVEFKDNELLDISRPQSQISKSDSERERIPSTGFSDDRPDSELGELAKQCSSEAITDPIERPVSPEPGEECEIKDDTPEFSSEAQASIGELEQEYSSAIARSQELISEMKKAPTKVLHSKENVDIHDVHAKVSASSSEKSSFEEAEAEAAFSMVAHISPAHKVKQICPILEDEDAEKHELETRERALKDLEARRSQRRDLSPGSIPDIKVTQHMAPLVDRGFHYPDLELEEKEEAQTSTPQTPASNSSKSSEETDQGREYILDQVETIPEEPDKEPMTESRSEVGTVVEKTVYETDKETDSPNSDSFEMLEKPDLIDDFVVIEEVGKEAQETDMEGKSVSIARVKKPVKKHDEELEQYLVKSAPQPSTKMTDIKYYPDGSSSEELGFDFEDSPPQPNQKRSDTSSKSSVESSPRDYVYEYDRELEANKKWIEQQFQGNHAAMMAAGYGYEMEFERGPLEDIKEEDIADFDPTSSRIGSLGSQKESGGSGSIKDSFSSTPDYDVLAGRKYFTKSGEHDDISMSSLQEFENLERVISLENRQKLQQGSLDSSNGSFKRYSCGRSGQGDDISVNSLKEFEGLEKACIAAHTIEVKAKEEEAMLLAQIEEGQESLASEADSCETISGTDKKQIESDEEDYEKRMFEIDEIIRQAQSNVEKFIDLRAVEKTESIGRGDSFEEVSKVPDLEFDTPLAKAAAAKAQQWSEPEDVMITSTDSLELKVEKPSRNDSSDSLDLKANVLGDVDVMTTSTDSIECQALAKKASERDHIMTDSIEIKEDFERSGMIASDSLELATGTNTNFGPFSDSIDEDGSRIGGHDQSTSSTGKDWSSSQRDELRDSDVFEASSSVTTHATCHYETDTIYSGSFTSGGSNTMVSSTDTVGSGVADREAIDLAGACRKVWFDEERQEYVEDSSKPYVTEVIEPCEEEGYSHTIHRRVELPPEVRKVTFTGPDADFRLKQYIENFGEGEDVKESEEVDADGNVHMTRVVQKRLIIKPDQEQASGVVKSTYTDSRGTKTIYTQQFDLPQLGGADTASAVQSLLTSIAGDTTGLS